MFKHTIRYNLSPVLILFFPIGLYFLLYRRKYLIGLVVILYMVVMFFATASARLLCGILTFVVLTLSINSSNFFRNKYVVNLVKLQTIFLVFITFIYFLQFGKYVFG